MAFTVLNKLSPVGRPRDQIEPTIRVSRSSSGVTLVTFNRMMMEKLKWIVGDRVEVAVGTGEDFGWIAVRRSKEGYRLCVDASKGRAKFGTKQLFPGEKVKSAVAQHLISPDGATVYVQMPPAIVAKRKTEFARNVPVNASMVAAE